MFKREEDVIIYNKEERTYTKIIKPRLNKKVKYFFKLRRYPGENVAYIANLFKNNNIPTLKVIEFDKYQTKTQEILGETLLNKILKSKNNEEIEELINCYIDIVTKIISIGVYYGDFNFENFLIPYNSKKQLITIDLEDYRKDFLCKFRKREMMRRLKKTLNEMGIILKKSGITINSEQIYKRIESNNDK